MKSVRFFARCVMAATLAVATVSCKKDDQSTKATIGANAAKEAYSQAAAIDGLYHSIDPADEHFRFIDAEIDGD